jgi:hypothetical protein
MRKAFLLIIITIISCKPNTPFNDLKSKIESSIKINLNNPDSFEFDSFIVIDTIFPIEDLNENKKALLKSKNRTQEIIKIQKGALDVLVDSDENSNRILRWEKKLNTSQNDLNEILKKIKTIDSLVEVNKNSTEPKNLKYIGVYKFRTLNEYNAKVLLSYKVIYDSNLNIFTLEKTPNSIN